MIDKTTGLPALPEGYRWFVAEDKPDNRSSTTTTTTTTTYRVILQQWKTQQTHVTEQYKRTWRTLWVNHEYVFNRSVKDMWVTVGQAYLFDFTDESIVETAKRVLATFNRKAYIKSRLGAYPPNSIPLGGGK